MSLLWLGAGYAVGHVIHNSKTTQCPSYPLPWPSTCSGWVSFMSPGYPTIGERGTQAENMVNDNSWWSKCSDADMNTLTATMYAYGLNAYDVAQTVDAIASSVHDKSMLCQVANIIETPPQNPCQLQNWKTQYMATMDNRTQGILNKWKGYC